jgi:coenzyme F420-reducing hydrogenase delta subunit/NAD-dependent dihydropyrimidine dehydrogenase PreA subunit
MALRRLARRAFARADALCDRLYGWRGNPLYQTGSLALLALAIVLATGIYLLLFYRIGDPYGSVARLQAQAWGGRWIRALHRYASDVAVAAALLHALRMFAQGRSFGPRALAWLSGLGLAALVFVCGWTGLVMVWDESARVIAVEGARLLDALPLFSEPLARTFSGERELPAAFFFLNLFAHIAVPIAVALVLWLHVSRLARPVLLPPRQLTLVATALLVAAAIAMPAPLAAEADPLRIPGSIPFDLFYALWVPLFAQLAPGTSWLWIAIAVAAPLLAPWWTRPRAAQCPRPSVGNEELCTGCLQCERDCPFAAIAMVPRGGDLADVFARVNPERCVSCGICAGSCAPMVIGPPDRGGRDQLAAARAFAAEHRLTPHDVVLVACANGAGGLAAERAPAGAPVWPVGCSGNLHSSVVEALLRGGAGGVLVAACPPRDCANREGSKWLEERLFAGREAELAERVDRRRVRVVFAGAGQRDEVLRALAALRVEVAALGRERRSDEDATGPECESSRARLAS